MKYNVRMRVVIVAVCAVGVALAVFAYGRDAVPSAASLPSTAYSTGERSLPPTRPATTTAPVSDDRRRQPAFVRAEDAGEDFSTLETSEVIRRLAGSNDRIVERKAAKVIGDRELAGKLSLSPDEQRILADYVEKQIGLTPAAVGKDRAEANDHIQRLWRLTADKLIDSLGSKNLTVVDAATKNLALMRDVNIVRKIIAGIETRGDATFKKYAILALGMMRSKQDCLLPDRYTLGDKESEAMATEIIVPFLTKLQTSEKDAETLGVIKMAFHFLENPPDARPRPSDRQAPPRPEQGRR